MLVVRLGHGAEVLNTGAFGAVQWGYPPCDGYSKKGEKPFGSAPLRRFME